jgi:hypothetical protein
MVSEPRVYTFAWYHVFPFFPFISFHSFLSFFFSSSFSLSRPLVLLLIEGNWIIGLHACSRRVMLLSSQPSVVWSRRHCHGWLRRCWWVWCSQRNPTHGCWVFSWHSRCRWWLIGVVGRLVLYLCGGLYCLRWPEISVVVDWFLLCVGLGGNCLVVIRGGFVRRR